MHDASHDAGRAASSVRADNHWAAHERKVQFPSKDAARAKVKQITDRPMRAYQCHICQLWHLTKDVRGKTAGAKQKVIPLYKPGKSPKPGKAKPGRWRRTRENWLEKNGKWL